MSIKKDQVQTAIGIVGRVALKIIGNKELEVIGRVQKNIG
jgi:hypothetical protein